MIQSGDLVFDIGALDGKYTDLYLARGARVIAVEPQPGRAAALREKYKDQSVTVVEKAVGSLPGRGKLHLTRVPWLATMIPEKWGTGRFKNYRWDNTVEVDVIILDELIYQYGMPVFIKIDVEGWEAQALAGLSKPVPELSFEFAEEFLDDVELCCELLSTIGDYEFAPSFYENNRPEQYGDAAALLKAIKASPLPLLWGDVYARLKTEAK